LESPLSRQGPILSKKPNLKKEIENTNENFSIGGMKMSKPMYMNKEIPDELNQKSLEALEIARDTGKIKRGINEATKAIERGLAKLILIATDIEPAEIAAHIPLLCEEKKIPYTFPSNKKKLGRFSGIDVNTSTVAVLDAGDARDLIKDLATKLAEF
jgi:large subunit ribosomal protein L7Ae